MTNKLNRYLAEGLIKRCSSEPLLLLAANFYSLVYEQPKCKRFITEDKIQIADKGVREIQLKANANIMCRLFDVKFTSGDSFRFAVHFYQRHNGNCLAVALPDEKGAYSNIIQMVLEKFVSIDKDSYWIYHDGTIGGKSIARAVVMTYIEQKGLPVHKSGIRKEIILGTIPMGTVLSWGDKPVQDFFDILFRYCLYRKELKASLADESPISDSSL